MLIDAIVRQYLQRRNFLRRAQCLRVNHGVGSGPPVVAVVIFLIGDLLCCAERPIPAKSGLSNKRFLTFHPTIIATGRFAAIPAIRKIALSGLDARSQSSSYEK